MIGIRNQVPLTKTGIQCLESGIAGMESRIQHCLGFPYTGRISRNRGNFLHKITEKSALVLAAEQNSGLIIDIQLHYCKSNFNNKVHCQCSS